MPKWEAFWFCKFKKMGTLALYLQSLDHLNVQKGGFSPPVHLVFHFFQPNLIHILRFAKGIS